MSDATWTIQISPRIGDALVNLRADTTDEMGKLVQWATEHAGDIAAAIAAFNLGAVGANPTVVPNTQVAPTQVPTNFPPAPAASSAPTCQHGQMTHRTGTSARGDWAAYFCPTPKGSPGQCKAIFL